MTRSRVAIVAAAAVLLTSAASRADVAAEVAAELALRPLERSLNEAGLRGFYSDTSRPPRARGRALYALYADKSPPLEAADRLRLLAALSDPAADVRAAALRAVGHARDRTLEGEALKRMAEDPDPDVRAEALRAVRPWARQGHLFFLQEALYSPNARVQAEALRNLAALPFREIPPEMLLAVEAAAGATMPAGVRLEALEALRRWGRLDWPTTKDVLMGDETSEALRLLALEASDRLAPADERGPALRVVLASDPSQRLAWEAFQRLKKIGSEEWSLVRQVSQYLAYSGRRNHATEEMAKYLRSKGYRVEYRSGAWKVTGSR